MPIDTEKSNRSVIEVLSEVASTLWNSPALALTIISGVLINIPVGSTWLDPSWLVEERGFTHARATLFLGVLFLIGGSFGNFIGGWLGDRFRRHWTGGRLIALVVIQLVVSPFGIAFRLIPPTSFMFPVCCAVSAILVTMIYGPLYASVQELTPLRIRSTMIAVLIVGLMLLGASLGAPLAARLAESFEAAGFKQPLTAGIFVTGQIGLLAVPLLLIAARRYSIDMAKV